MSIKKELFKSFLEVLPDEPSVVVIHSSFSRLLPPKDFNYSDALYSIKELDISESFIDPFCGSVAIE